MKKSKKPGGNYWRLLAAVQKSPDLQALEYEKCRRNLLYWLEMYVWTLDEHDEYDPVKRFPLQEGCPEVEYLREVVREWEGNTLLAVEKSRKMLITWLFTAVHLWIGQFGEGRLVFFQSRKEEDADRTLDRAKFIYDHEATWLKPHFSTRRYCHLEWPTRHSELWAIPQGPDIIRQYTASAIFSDEMAFQDQAQDAFIAAKPTIDGGGKFTAVSSAYPGFFEELCRDRTA